MSPPTYLQISYLQQIPCKVVSQSCQCCKMSTVRDNLQTFAAADALHCKHLNPKEHGFKLRRRIRPSKNNIKSNWKSTKIKASRGRKRTRRHALTFCSAFSFSSSLWVAVSRFVWVWASSFSNCCIFFSRASTSSLAFSVAKPRPQVGWRTKNKEKKKENTWKSSFNSHFEGLSLSPRASGLRSSAFLESYRGRFPCVASSY